jgi:hypothetical protein
MKDPFGLTGELAPEEICIELTRGLTGPLPLTKLQVPHGSPGPRADSVCTLNLRVVRGENSETTIA